MAAETRPVRRWGRLLPDQLNPRVGVRNWLTQPTKAESTAAEQRYQAALAGIRSQALRDAASRARALDEIGVSQQRFDQALAAARDCATAEAMLAGQLRELLPRMRQRNEASYPSPEAHPDASAAPVRPERDPGSVGRSLPGEEG